MRWAIGIICVLLSVLILVFWPLSNTRGANGKGFAFGVRRAPSFSYRPGFHVIWGIYLENSRAEVWYYTGSVPFVGSLDCVAGNEGLELLDVRLIAYEPNARDWYYAIGLPFWLLTPIALIGARLMRSRRAITPAGICGNCGYELRATPDRCPECGTIVTRANAYGQSR